MEQVAVINFSGRCEGNCHGIAEFIKNALTVSYEINVKEMHSMNITPCGKCGYECFINNAGCPHENDDILDIYNTICSSDLAFYIVPNYVEYPNANYFIFRERGACFFLNKPIALQEKYGSIDLGEIYRRVKKKFIVVSNTGKENFKRAFKSHIDDNMDVDILFLAAIDYDKSAILGDLMDSPKARIDIENFIKE